MQQPTVDAAIRDAIEGLPPLLSLRDFAEFFGITERTAREWARTPGKLRVHRTAQGGSGRVLILRAEVGRVLAEMRDPQLFEEE